jgi:hypothetical protein
MFRSMLTGSLQGIAERPLPCIYNEIRLNVAFHGGNAGSNPAGDAIYIQQLTNRCAISRRHKKEQLPSGLAGLLVSKLLALVGIPVPFEIDRRRHFVPPASPP